MILVEWTLTGVWIGLTVLAWISTKSTLLNEMANYGKLVSKVKRNQRKEISHFELFFCFLSEPFFSKQFAFTSYYVFANLFILGFYVIFHVSFTDPQWLTLILFHMHVIRRLGECMFVHKYSKSEVNFLVWFFGVFHYLCATFTIGVGCKQIEQGGVLVKLIGICLFFFASYHQFACHLILARYRLNSQDSVIPFGDWFDSLALTMPHYFAEILIYLSFAILLHRIASIWALLIWVISNLSVTASKSFRWYLQNFGGEFLALKRFIIMPHIY